MLTVNDIKNAKFRRSNIGGYKTEDVDSFLDEIQNSYEKLQSENLDLTQKIKILADRISQYRKDEDSVKSALVSAQKLADSAINSAKKEADDIIEDAKKEAEMILKNADKDIKEQKETLLSLKKSVKDFRSHILSLYKDHLKLVNSFNSEDRIPASALEKTEKLNEENKKEDITLKTDFVPNVENVSKEEKISKFTDLKFGENYEISNDKEESPLGLFN